MHGLLFLVVVGALVPGLTTSNLPKDVVVLMNVQLLKLTHEEAEIRYHKLKTLLNSAVLLGSVLQSVVYSFIARRLGFRRTGMLGSGRASLFVLLQCIPFSDYAIIGYRIAQGFFMTMYMISVLGIVGEKSTATQKGLLGYIFQICFSFGILASTLIEFLIISRKRTFNLWFLSFLFTLPWPVIGFLTLLLSEEGLITKQQLQFQQIFCKKYYKIIFLSILVGILQQCTGINAVIIYASSEINTKLKNSQIYNFGSLIINIVNFISPVVGACFVELVGRKVLLFTGTGICILGQVIILLNYCMPIPSSNLLLTGSFIFVFGFEIGPGPLCFVLATELFPYQTKTCLLSLYFLFNYLPNLLVIISFPFLTKMALYAPFLSYIFGMAIFSSILAFFLPETKGKSNGEIEQVMIGQNNFFEKIDKFLYFIAFAVLASALSIIIFTAYKYS